MTGVTTTTLTHRYAAPGEYPLLLTVNPRGVRQNLTVGVPAGALALSAQDLIATAALSGLEPELTYTLDWGDGASDTTTGSAAAGKTHAYALPGTYTVTLTSPGVGTATGTVTVSAVAPVLTVSAVTLTATAQLSGLLPGAEYLLEWGDGAGQYIQGQAALTATHVYAQPGPFVVKVAQVSYRRLPGILGASASLTVGLPPREAMQVLNTDDLGAGYHFRVTGMLPEGVYVVDYGDGTSERLNSSADVTLDHTYMKSGAYTVTLLFRSYGGDLVRTTSVQQVQIALGVQNATLSFTKPFRDADLSLNTAEPIEATLTVSYRGGGRLSGRWVLDGRPVENVDLTLTEASGTATAPVTFTRTETFPGRHTLTFEFTGTTPLVVRPVTYALNAPGTLSYGGFKVVVSTITKLSVMPGGVITVSGTGTATPVVGGTPLAGVNVTFADQQVTSGGTVISGPATTVELNGQSVRNARLGDLGLRVDRLTLTKDGAALSGSVTLPAVGRAAATLSFTDAPLAADSGDLMAAMHASTPIQNVALPEPGLSLSAGEVTLDLSAAKNTDALAGAYKDQAKPSNDWMGLVFPDAQLRVSTPILRQAVTLSTPVAYNLSGYVTTLDLAAGSAGVLGWDVDLTALHSSVVAGRISTTRGAGSVVLPLVDERMNVSLGWNTNAKSGERFTFTSSGTVKKHTFGKTSLDLGQGVWTWSEQGVASVVFSNALWHLQDVGRDNAQNLSDVNLNNLTMSGNGDVSVDGHPWSSVTGKTNLTLFGYPFAAAEVGVQRQSSGAYTLGLRGRFQVNEHLPVNTTDAPLLFWVQGGKDVKVTTERIRLAGEVAKVPFDITLDGALTDEGRLEFTGDGKMNMAGLLDVKAKALFGRFNGTNYEYFKPNTAGSVGYGSVLASAAGNAALGKPLISVKRVEVYELQGGVVVNMDWPNGLDNAPRFRESGPNTIFQAGALLSVKQDPGAPFKPFVKGILSVGTAGGLDMKADAWLVKTGQTLNQSAPNGRALVSISAPLFGQFTDGRLLVQACVGPNGISSVGGLNCAGVAELNLYDLMKLRGSLELYAPFSGDAHHLYVGTKESPIVVNLPSVPEGRGYLMIDKGSVNVGAGVTWGFEKGDSGSLLVCSWNWNIKATANLDAEFGITYAPVALDGGVKFDAQASASAGGCGINVGVAANMTFDGKLHVASAERYFDGSVSANVSLPVIPDIGFNVKTKVKF